MEELFKQLLKEVEKSTMGMAVLSAKLKDDKSTQEIKSVQEILSDWRDEYDPNSESCQLCQVAELCKIVSRIKKSNEKTDGKVQPSEEKPVDKEFKEMLGDMAEAGDWMVHILLTLINKGEDYGDTFKKLTRKDKTYPINQMLTKVYRIENLLKSNKSTNFESIEDSLADLIGYAMLTYKAIKDGDLK